MNLTVVPWNKLLATHGFGFDAAVNAKNIVRAIYGSNIRQLSAFTYDKVFAKMKAFYAAHPDARVSLVELEIFPNQATAAVPRDRTAYPWRDVQGYMYVSYHHIYTMITRNNKCMFIFIVVS